MISCPVCATSNHHLSVTCSSCGGYIQRRIDNLDLFDTAWKVIEAPKKAFREIAIAQHKNYGVTLSGFAGIGFMFTIFWILKIGERNSQLFNVLVAGVLTGPFVGWIFILLISFITYLIIRVCGEKASFRNTFAISVYSLIPIVISVFTILPLELMTWGIYLFTISPSQYLLHPLSWILVVGLDTLCGLWSVALYLVALKALLDIKWIKILEIGLISLALLSGLLTEVIYFLKQAT